MVDCLDRSLLSYVGSWFIVALHLLAAVRWQSWMSLASLLALFSLLSAVFSVICPLASIPSISCVLFGNILIAVSSVFRNWCRCLTSWFIVGAYAVMNVTSVLSVFNLICSILPSMWQMCIGCLVCRAGDVMIATPSWCLFSVVDALE